VEKKVGRGKPHFTWLPLGRLGPPGPRKKNPKDINKKKSSKITTKRKQQHNKGEKTK
jgi:hypothetical protein